MKKTKFNTLFITLAIIFYLIVTINYAYAQKITDTFIQGRSNDELITVDCKGDVANIWMTCTYVDLQNNTIELIARRIYMGIGITEPSADFLVPYKRKSCTFTLWQKKVRYCGCAHCAKHGYHMEGPLDKKTIK